MTDQDKAVDKLKELIEKYDFSVGRNHLIKIINPNKKIIQIDFIFGLNITAKFDYQMGSWFELKSRYGDIHKFYWEDNKTKNWIDEKIKKATTCFCGLENLKYSDGYPYMQNCPNGERYYGCKPIEVNEFSVLIPNYTR